MLSRSAEGLYWTGRYLERTDHLCRLLRVQVETLVDRPVREIHFGWRRIYASLGRLPPGANVALGGADDDLTLADAYTLADHLTFERTNPDSVRNGFSMARENARQMRHCISAEFWTTFNLAWLRFKSRRIEEIWKTAPETFYTEVSRDIDTLGGVAATTMYRDEGWRFLELGRYTERAMLMLALVLAHLTIWRRQAGESVRADDSWSSLLRVCQAVDAYRRRHGVEVRPARVIDLLVNDPRLPRSLCHSFAMTVAELQALPIGPGPMADARRLASQMGTALRNDWPAGSSLDAREACLRTLQARFLTLHGLVMAAYVGYDADGAPVR
ncbi:MAG: alpha-E domain-containing protein [Acidobacteria bacterium]|nr:alpha-E domain-containing protein [Acidobacteriota bacterium]